MKKILIIGILIILIIILFLNFNTKKYNSRSELPLKYIIYSEDKDSVKLKNYKKAYNNSVELYNKILQYDKVVLYNYIAKRRIHWEDANSIVQCAIDNNKEIFI